jgi:pantothenate kinase
MAEKGMSKLTGRFSFFFHFSDLIYEDICVVLPMDGFHYYKSQLSAMPNSEEAFQRRGAHWTFDASKFASLLSDIKIKGFGLAPSFDHAVGDPLENDVKIDQKHRIVLVEGNYLYLDLAEWKPIANLLDEKWFIEVDEDVAMERVVKRHMGTGNSEEMARFRVENNDRLNAREINQSKTAATRIFKSIEES